MKKCLVQILTCVIFCAGFVGHLQAAGNLMVTPTRIVFDERDRSAQVTLVNQGDASGNFRISFILSPHFLHSFIPSLQITRIHTD